MQYQFKQKSPTIINITRGAPSNLDTFKETADAINWLTASSWSGVASATTFDDSNALLWVTNVKEAIEALDDRTDQIDDVVSQDYASYISSKL